MGAEPPPSSVELLTGAVIDAVRRPTQVVDLVRGGLNDALNVGLRAAESAGTRCSRRSRARPRARRPTRRSTPRSARPAGGSWSSTDLDDYRLVRKRLARGAYAEDVTINDVVLATIAGGFRSWLLGRGEAVSPHTSCAPWCRSASTATTPPACMPTRSWPASSTCRSASRAPRCGCTRSPSPCASRWRAARRSGPPRSPTSPGSRRRPCTPSGARLGSAMSRRLYNVMITNVPGPQTPALRRRRRDALDLSRHAARQGQALSIGITSYNGGVYYGLNADRDAMPDVDVLGRLDRRVPRGADEWAGVLMPVVRVYVPLGTARSGRARRRRGRSRRCRHGPRTAYAVTVGSRVSCSRVSTSRTSSTPPSATPSRRAAAAASAPRRPPGRRGRRRRPDVGLAGDGMPVVEVVLAAPLPSRRSRPSTSTTRSAGGDGRGGRRAALVRRDRARRSPFLLA